MHNASQSLARDLARALIAQTDTRPPPGKQRPRRL